MRLDELKQRIALASPAQLIVITYELLIQHMANAVQDFDTEAFPIHLEKARACVNELSAALNLEIPMSAALLRLYMYINQLLIRAQMENETAPVTEAQKLINHMLNAWQEIAASTNAASNDKTMFAGLTYTKNGGLSEYEPDEPGRGYLA